MCSNKKDKNQRNRRAGVNTFGNNGTKKEGVNFGRKN